MFIPKMRSSNTYEKRSSLIPMSLIAHTKTRGEVVRDTRRVMNLANWEDHLRGQTAFVKVNYMSDQVIPSLCTSPWVLEGVLQELTEKGFEVIVGDADLATNKQLMKAVRNWGVLDLCKKYDAKFVNLSEEPIRKVKTRLNAVRFIPFADVILDADAFLTIPVAKTHYLTRLTCGLKNQWGVIPTFRHQYHPIADQLIPEINRLLDVDFVVVDATICMEGEGPRTGIPKLVNSIFASSDVVAMDRCVQEMMGLKGDIGHVIEASRVIPDSSLEYTIVGDSLETFQFTEAKKTIITKVEMLTRNIPLLGKLIFSTGLFSIPARIATEYNTFWYYIRDGVRFRRQILHDAPEYRKLYIPLLKDTS